MQPWVHQKLASGVSEGLQQFSKLTEDIPSCVDVGQFQRDTTGETFQMHPWVSYAPISMRVWLFDLKQGALESQDNLLLVCWI